MKLHYSMALAVFCSSCATPVTAPPSSRPMNETQTSAPVGPFDAWKAKNDEFMRQVSRTPGVECTPTGLCYEGLRQGTAPPPDDDDLVVIAYRQTLIDGSPVQSFDREAPARFAAGKVIWGFVEALKLMHAPAEARFYVPAQLAFDDRGAGTRVPPWSALIIDVELIRVGRVE